MGGKGTHFAGFVLCHFVLGVFFAFFAFAVGSSGLWGEVLLVCGFCVGGCIRIV